jgi:hypothetical protein
MSEDLNSANPADETVEESISDDKKRLDPKEYSIAPPGLEGDGIPPKESVNRDITRGAEAHVPVTDYEELSSDHEEDTTEGEITDVETST